MAEAAIDYGPLVDQIIRANTPSSQPVAPSAPTPTAPEQDYSARVQQILQAYGQDSAPTEGIAFDITKGPETPAPGPPDDSGASWLPGFEFMHLLSPDQQSSIVEQLPGIARTLAAMGIGAAGGIGGTMLGSLTSPVTGPVGPIVGELGGSFAARKLNVALGLEDPGTIGDVASFALPAGVRAAGSIAKPLIRRLPGASLALHQDAAERLAALAPEPSGTALPALGTVIQDLAPPGTAAPAVRSTLETLRPPAGSAIDRLETALSTLDPPVPSATLYAPVHADVTPIRPSNIMRTLRAITREEERLAPAFQEGKLQRAAQGMLDMIRQGNGAVPINRLLEHQQRLGLMVADAANHQWPEEAGLRRLYGSVYDDIRYAVTQGVPGARQYLQAATTHNREMALTDMRRMLQPGSPGVGTTVRGDVQLPSGQQLERTLERRWLNDPLFAQAFSPMERQQLRQVLRDVRSTDAIEGFLERLQPGKAGMGTDASTGTTTIGNITPLREAFERELADNPAFAIGVPGAAIARLRRLMAEAEQDQTVRNFLDRLQPGKPGVGLDPATGGPRLENSRPLRLAFERELASTPTFARAIGPTRTTAIREAFAVAEQEHVEQTLSHMLRPGAPGWTIRPDGAVQLHGGQIRKTFEQALVNDPQFSAGVSADMRAGIRRALNDIERLPRPPPPWGQQYGGGRNIMRGAVAAGIASSIGLGPVGAATLTAATLGIPQVISRMLMSPTGRRLLLRALATEGGLSPALLGALNTGSREAATALTDMP